MKTYTSFDCDGKARGINSDLEVAKSVIRANLIIESDPQFLPMKVINAWCLCAHANSPAYWMQTDTKWATERLASDVLYAAIRSDDISAPVS